MHVNRLLSDELSYEIRVLGEMVGNTVVEKRRIVRQLLNSNTAEAYVEFPAESELATCANKFDEFLGIIHEFDYTNAVNEYERIKARLLHVHR